MMRNGNILFHLSLLLTNVIFIAPSIFISQESLWLM